MRENSPLVSVVVITYNSEKYILETLESVKDQTYDKIELIISDDGSRDNTIEICKTWLFQNDARFCNSKIISVKENTGIPANCNRGVLAAKGTWIKLIAGDDVLYNDCISVNWNYLAQNKHIDILQTQSTIFTNILNPENIISNSPKESEFFDFDSEIQNKLLQEKNLVIAPSVIFSREIFNQIGGFDENYKFFEDITFWLNATKSGTKIYFLKKSTVFYRKHNETSEKASKPFMRKQYAKELLKFRKEYNDKIKPINKFKYMLRLKFFIMFDNIGLNHYNSISRFLYYSINKLLR